MKIQVVIDDNERLQKKCKNPGDGSNSTMVKELIKILSCPKEKVASIQFLSISHQIKSLGKCKMFTYRSNCNLSLKNLNN